MVAKPLPLIFAKGAADLGVDYDFNFVRRYISKIAPSAMNELWNLSHRLETARPKSALESFRTIMKNRLGVEQEVSTRLLRWFIEIGSGEDGVRTWIDQKEVEKEMAAYMEPWQHLLPKKIFAMIGPAAQPPN